MKNAHLRMGQLEYRQFTRNIATNIRVRVDRYMGEKEQAHLLSLFGGDTEIGAISAAIAENARFTLALPDGSSHVIWMGEHASCYRGAIPLSGRKQPLRHLLAVSQHVQGNGSAGTTYMLNFHRELVWNTLVSVLGIPAVPEWGTWILSILQQKKLIKRIEGLGCSPVRINVTRAQILKWVGRGVHSGKLAFPEQNGPILWPSFTMRAALMPVGAEPAAEPTDSTAA
jgi:hypothetical protein